jgi:hypothetical protein
MAEVDELPFGLEPGLFTKFTAGCLERIFPLIELSLGNGPCPMVFPAPVWTAGMDEKHLDLSVSVSIHEYSGTLSGHDCPCLSKDYIYPPGEKVKSEQRAEHHVLKQNPPGTVFSFNLKKDLKDNKLYLVSMNPWQTGDSWVQSFG